MKIYPECYNCFISQAIRSSKIHTKDRQKILSVVRGVVNALVGIDHSVAPPLISENVYGTIRRILGVDDPYETIKKKYSDIALSYVPFAKQLIKSSEDPLGCALKLSLSGNIIDFGSEVRHFNIKETIKQTVESGFDINDKGPFTSRLQKAEKLVLLADNAGESVFDKMLLETIKELYPNIKIYVFVRGGPIINDVTRKDALYVGLDSVSEIVEAGRAIPGFWPDYCNNECREIWDKADIVISKGQGNFETLTEIEDSRIYFLFIVKCRVVAEFLGCEKYSKVFKRNGKI